MENKMPFLKFAFAWLIFMYCGIYYTYEMMKSSLLAEIDLI